MNLRFGLRSLGNSFGRIATDREFPSQGRRYVLERAFFAPLFSIAGAPLSSARAPALPALVRPASQELHVGKVIFCNLFAHTANPDHLSAPVTEVADAVAEQAAK